ncbi:MAG: protein-tyrosine-phosphatase [Verrucomicrobiota bacterium]
MPNAANDTRLRVLFVCAMNRWRSPTAEAMYRNDPRVAVRSAGVRQGARRPLSRVDLEWAQILVVMEREHLRRIREAFSDLPLPTVWTLDIPDDYRFMDPELQELLRAALEPELKAVLNAASTDTDPSR